MIDKKKIVDQEVKVILAGWLPQGKPESLITEYLDELSFLAETAGATEIKRFYQKLPHPDSRTFLGSGKLLEIKEYISKHPVEMVIFDDELSGSQISNIEEVLKRKVIDVLVEVFSKLQY